MFEAVELDRQISKADYRAQLPDLRAELLQMQFALTSTKRPVIILITGTDGAGRGEVVNVLNEWLDPRGIETSSFERLTDEERERPKYWRYWRKLPARGRIGIFFGGWYVDPIRDYAYKQLDVNGLDEELAHIRRFETMQEQDKAIIIKFWLHLSQKDQIKRLKKMEKDPGAIRRVSERDWRHVELYNEFQFAAERAIRHTDTGEAPWHLVEAKDERYRNLTVGRIVLDVVRKRLEADVAQSSPQSQPIGENSETTPVLERYPFPKANRTVLDTIDLGQQLDDKTYRHQIELWQGKLQRLVWAAEEKRVSSVIVFEGPDAGGKGGAIRRMSQAMDARLRQVISTAAPTDEERAHHYLWRFWRHIPHAGTFTIYDRSWYGRVLVERVEQFATEHEWMRAYLEINNFEEMLVNHGTMVVKFWLHISQDEQLKRFKEREQIAYKRHKITEEDWRNREKWDTYALAVNDMVVRTSTSYAPWTLVAGNDKQFARIEVLKTVCNRLEQILDSK